MLNLFKAKPFAEPEPQRPDYKMTCEWCRCLSEGVCRRFPSHVPIKDPSTHTCGEWDECSAVTKWKNEHFNWRVRKMRW